MPEIKTMRKVKSKTRFFSPTAKKNEGSRDLIKSMRPEQKNFSEGAGADDFPIRINTEDVFQALTWGGESQEELTQ